MANAIVFSRTIDRRGPIIPKAFIKRMVLAFLLAYLYQKEVCMRGERKWDIRIKYNLDGESDDENLW